MKSDNVKILNQKFIFLFSLVSCFFFLLPKISFGAPLGKGTFMHNIHIFNELTPEGLNEGLTNPYICGVQLTYEWRQLEPTEGNFQWSIIDEDIKPWADAGKKVWIEVITANKRGSEVQPRGFPDWITLYNVPIVGYYHEDPPGTQRGRYPVFWNSTYQALWEKFVAAFAAKYDGNRNIEFIAVTGYSAGDEPRLSAEDNGYYFNDWISAGLDPGISKTRVNSDNYYSQAEAGNNAVYLKTNLWAIDLFKKYFKRTLLMINVIKRDKAWSQERYIYAASKGVGLGSNGLNVQVDLSYRQWARDMQLQYKVPVAFFEFANARLKPDGTSATLLEVYKSGMGIDGDTTYGPWSRISYMPVGDWRSDLETYDEWKAALKWVYEAELNLRNVPLPPAGLLWRTSENSDIAQYGNAWFLSGGRGAHFGWCEVEPEPGVYDFSAVRAYINAWKAYGKKAAIAVSPASSADGKSCPCDDGNPDTNVITTSPEWLFKAPYNENLLMRPKKAIVTY